MRQRQLVLTVLDSVALSRRLGVIFATAMCAVLVVSAAPASGALTYPFDGQLAPAGGSFGVLGASSVAVDDFNHDTYVADSKTGVIDVFDASGAQLPTIDGSATPAGSFGGGEVSVAANNGTGDVYVLDSTHSVIDEFDSSGTYLCQITGSATPSTSECNGVAGSDTPAHGLSSRPRDVVLDQTTGEVYVLDTERGAVDVFGVGGEYLRQVSLSSAPGGFSYSFAYASIAVSGFNGHLYAADFLGGRVFEFDAAGSYVATWTGSNTPAQSFAQSELSVAIDDTNGDVYITDPSHKVTDVFDSSGGYLTQFSHSYELPDGTAVDQASGRVYVSDEAVAPTPQVVYIFGPALVIPDVITETPTNVKATSVTLNGTVNPDGIQLSDCHFDYGTDTSYGQTAPCVPAAGSIVADSSEHAVSADIDKLEAGVTYHFRLEAANANGSSAGEDVPVTTLPPPSIDGATAANVTAGSVDLDTQIDPNGYETTYHIEWGTSTSYGATVPIPDEDIGAGTSDVARSQHVAGLTANTTYHWRVVAVNANGTRFGVDHTFVYDTTGGGLPDNRAYEMVSPPHKNGALLTIPLFSLLPQVAADGTSLVSPSVQCYADAASCNAVRELEIGSPYAFSRTSSGWVTTSLSPSATQFPASSAVSFDVEAGTAIFSAPTAPFYEDDFYRRTPDGSFIDIGPSSPPSAGAKGEPIRSNYGESEDQSRFVWNATPVWPFDATTGGNTVYEYAGVGNAQPLLVGVSGGQGSADLISACTTRLPAKPGSVSSDGRIVYFIAGACSNGSGVNKAVEVPTNELYARIDGERSDARTVAISGHSPEDCTAACASSPASEAAFVYASADGSKAFFTSKQQLTDEATEGKENLYLYDFDSPEGHNLIDVSAGSKSGGAGYQGVLAISSDGSHAYFVARGVLTATANARGQVAHDGANNLYLFEHDAGGSGGITFITQLSKSHETEWTGFGGSSDIANVTPDGRFLVFGDSGHLTVDDSSLSGAQQVFRYDAQTGELVRISIGNDGFNDNGNHSTPSSCSNAGCNEDAHIVPPATRLRRDPTMSDDGAYVFFQSPVALTPQALDDVSIGTNADGLVVYAQNVYEWHAGHVYLISDGRDVTHDGGQFGELCGLTGLSSVCLLGSDTTGSNVFLSTADQLVSSDTDTSLDFYDARICTSAGPCIKQAPPPLPPCLGEACHGTPAATPSSPSAPTVTFNGQGNLTSPLLKATSSKKVTKRLARCARGKARRHGRCVKAKAKRSKQVTGRVKSRKGSK